MKLTRTDVLNITHDELNIEIDRHIFGRHFMSVEEMKENSAYWWKSQPGVKTFTAGYDAWIDENKQFQYKHRTDPYSTNIADAWKVVVRMKILGWSFTLAAWGDEENVENEFFATFGFENGKYQAEEITAQFAICKAALLAILELK